MLLHTKNPNYLHKIFLHIGPQTLNVLIMILTIARGASHQVVRVFIIIEIPGIKRDVKPIQYIGPIFF